MSKTDRLFKNNVMFPCLVFGLVLGLFIYIGLKSPKTSPAFTSFKITSTTTLVIENTTTTETSVVLETTIQTIPKTTSSSIYVTTTTPQIVEHNAKGPPHNTTSLVGCIAYYESNWGVDPNVFQFEQSTWETYGGTGSPSRASYDRQEEIFWLAWEDAGYHHWAAQQGRCF